MTLRLPILLVKLRYMHLPSLDDRSSLHIYWRLPFVQRRFVAFNTLLCTILLSRAMHRNNLGTVWAFRPTKVVKRMIRRLVLFKIPRTVLRASSTAHSDGAGFFEEGDEERLDGWEARGYDSDVHFDDLPDVYQVSLSAAMFCRIRSLGTRWRMAYNTMTLRQ